MPFFYELFLSLYTLLQLNVYFIKANLSLGLTDMGLTDITS